MSTPDRPRQWGTTLPQRDKPLPRNRPALTLIHDIGSGKQRQRKPTGFGRIVKLAVRARAGNGNPEEACCEACWCWLGRYGGEIQHRKARGMGGTPLQVTNSIVNAALLCGSGALRTGCHGKCESRDREMHARGYWLEQGQDPVTEPIRPVPAITLYLLLNGTYGRPKVDGDGAA